MRCGVDLFLYLNSGICVFLLLCWKWTMATHIKKKKKKTAHTCDTRALNSTHERKILVFLLCLHKQGCGGFLPSQSLRTYEARMDWILHRLLWMQTLISHWVWSDACNNSNCLCSMLVTHDFVTLPVVHLRHPGARWAGSLTWKVPGLSQVLLLLLKTIIHERTGKSI